MSELIWNWVVYLIYIYILYHTIGRYIALVRPGHFGFAFQHIYIHQFIHWKSNCMVLLLKVKIFIIKNKSVMAKSGDLDLTYKSWWFNATQWRSQFCIKKVDKTDLMWLKQQNTKENCNSCPKLIKRLLFSVVFFACVLYWIIFQW